MPLGFPDLPHASALSPDVQAALHDLYETFSPYTPRDLDPSWREFWHPAEQAVIEALPVRVLPEDLMAVVLAHMVSVYGGAQDLKYFLLRLLEVAIESPLREGMTAVLSSAYQAEMWSWPEVERASVSRFLRAWWQQCLEEPVNFNTWPVEDALCAAAFVFDDLSPLLTAWARDERLNATLHAMNTARLHLSERNGELELQPFWEQRPLQADQVRVWLLSPAVLERLREAKNQKEEEPAHQLLQETEECLSKLVAK